MATPQLENGYLKIANSIVEALIRQPLSGQEFRIALLVIRKTYGFNKTRDHISLSQMAKNTGISKVRCSQITTSLEAKKLLTVTENINGLTKEYKFNKDFETWQTVTEKCNRIRKVKKTVTEKCNHKRHSYKKQYSPDILRLSGLLADLILKNNPKHTKLSNGRYQYCVQLWAADIDSLHRIDKQSLEDIQHVIEWTQADSFEYENILSGEKLRKRWDELYVKTIKDKGTQTQIPPSQLKNRFSQDELNALSAKIDPYEDWPEARPE